MKTYRVTLTQFEDFDVIVEAKNEKDAMDEADERFSRGDYQETGNLSVETKDVVQICSICKQPKDDDGRCSCTNKDSK